MQGRRIIHIDMDAFFAAVEQRDFPQYRNKPVIVGGSPQRRGVVATCSYEARKFGVHSAMPSFMARKLCPQGIFVTGRYDVYSRVSRQIMDIFHKVTPKVEALSLDEAYLDVTPKTKNLQQAVTLAQSIKNRIKNNLHLTASAGVSYNKFLAKLASDMDKPDGLTFINQEQAPHILDNLKIRQIFGIGKVTEQKLLLLGIKTGKDLKERNLNELIKIFGKAGKFYYDIVRGIDDRPVVAAHVRKSLGKERTLPVDTYDVREMSKMLEGIAVDVAQLLNKKGLQGKTVTLKIKYEDFVLNTRSISLKRYISDAGQIAVLAKQLLDAHYKRSKGVRLLGISVSNLNTGKKETQQLYLDFYYEDE